MLKRAKKYRMLEPTHPHYKISIIVRSFKTAFACILCAILYLLIDRNPTFACIGVIFGMGGAFGNSIIDGGNRLFGTIIGGLLGMGLFRLYLFAVPDGKASIILIPFLFVGVLLLILSSSLFRWPGAVLPGGVVLCIILYNTPIDQYVSYSLNRILDTSIGVILAFIVAIILPKDKLIKAYLKIFGRNTNEESQ